MIARTGGVRRHLATEACTNYGFAKDNRLLSINPYHRSFEKALMTNIINYKKIINSASLGAIRDILLDVSQNGLPGEHHFYITFNMVNEGVETSISLKEQYPEEMTIVIQNWYDGFLVTDEAFFITLNFGNSRETMKIPFSSIKSFVDPSVEFGLSFDPQLDAMISSPTEVQTDSDETLEPNLESDNKPASERKSGEVISLESFRKP